MNRFTFNAFIDRAFWTILLGIIGFGVKFLADLSVSVQDLNSRVGIMVERLAYHDEKISKLGSMTDKMGEVWDLVKSHDYRLDHLEKHLEGEGGHYERLPSRRGKTKAP